MFFVAAVVRGFAAANARKIFNTEITEGTEIKKRKRVSEMLRSMPFSRIFSVLSVTSVLKPFSIAADWKRPAVHARFSAVQR